MERKCIECKKTIEFDKNNYNKIIRFSDSFYHHDCFINACKRKSKKSNASPKWKEALDCIDNIKKETEIYLNREIYKDELYNFMVDNYHPSVIPSKIFTKLDSIYNGTYRGLACCIPPEDILDMWKRKMNYLIKVRARNLTLGKEMDAVSQINYDISVLINMYDSYLKWKEQNKVYEQDVVCSANAFKIDFDKLSKAAQKKEKEEEEDIDSLLDELFD